jgi:hypothetical protein
MKPIAIPEDITCLEILCLPLGFLINFNKVPIKDGIHRIPNLLLP